MLAWLWSPGGYDRHIDFGDAALYGPGIASGTGSPYEAGSTAIFERCWQHAFAVFDQGEQRESYTVRNGLFGRRTTAVNTEGYTNFTLGGGRWEEGAFSGYLRRVKVYNRALSEFEIRTKYLETKPELFCECLTGFRGVEETGCIGKRVRVCMCVCVRVCFIPNALVSTIAHSLPSNSLLFLPSPSLPPFSLPSSVLTHSVLFLPSPSPSPTLSLFPPDIDECFEETDTCNPLRGVCHNFPGFYNCTCADGFFGNGRTCDPPAPCVMSEWEQTDNCTATCGIGVRTEEREVLRVPIDGGASCPTDLQRQPACFAAPCSGRTALDVIIRTDTDTYNASQTPPFPGLDAALASLEAAGAEVALTAVAPATAVVGENADPDAVVLQLVVDVAAGGDAAARNELLALASPSVDVAAQSTGDCYCSAVEEAGVTWLGAPCGQLSPTQYTCPGSNATFVTRNCTGAGESTGGWAAFDASLCVNDDLADLAGSVEAAAISATLAGAVAQTTGRSRLLGVADVANIERILNETIHQQMHNVTDLSPDDVFNFLRLFSHMLDASEDVVTAGLSTYGEITGTSLMPDAEEMLLFYAENVLPLDESLSVVEANVAVDLYHASSSPTAQLQWPPANARAAISRRCYGAVPDRHCSVIEYGTQPVAFDPGLTITVPQTVVNLSMALSAPLADVTTTGAAANLSSNATTSNSNVTTPVAEETGPRALVAGVGAWATRYLFPSGTLRRTLSQMVFATLPHLPEEYNISSDPVLYSATPRFYNGTDASCAVWLWGSWDESVCTLLNPEVPSGAYECECAHLTTFGLVEVQTPRPSFLPPQYEDYVRGCIGLACFFLLFTLLVYLLQPSKWSPSRMVVMHQCATLIAAFVLFAIGFYDTRTIECRRVAVAQHALMCAFLAWLLAGAVLAVFRRARAWQVLLIGYVLPAAVVVPTALTMYQDYGRKRWRTDPDKHCFIDVDKDLVWTMYGPCAGFAGVAALVYFGIMCYSMCCWPKDRLEMVMGLTSATNTLQRRQRSKRKENVSLEMEMDTLGSADAQSTKGEQSGGNTSSSDDDVIQPVSRGYALWMSFACFLLACVGGCLPIGELYYLNAVTPDLYTPLFAGGALLFVSCRAVCVCVFACACACACVCFVFVFVLAFVFWLTGSQTCSL